MAITISREIERKLPAAERAGILEFLRAKAGGICSLCDGALNEASDTIEPDHIIPERENGRTERANLSLAHKTCNAFKRNSPSIDVRPFLKLRRYMMGLGGQLAHYGDALGHFGVQPQPSRISDSGEKIQFEFPDGTIATSDALEEANRERTYRFVYVDVPRQAIFNDEDCQPRTIKPEHLWKLYSDIQRNPLHEPPSLRLGETDGAGLTPLLMFDGQHKSIAVWMSNRATVVAKVYLDLDKDETIRLVNSIQARIPKLPLSTFELSAKMDDENAARLVAYLDSAGASATEKGFIDSTDVAIRAHVRTGFKLALANSIIENPDLLFVQNVAKPGERAGGITENAFKTKLVDPLLHLQPLEEPWAQSEVQRGHEQDGIVRALNRLHEIVFQEPAGGFTDHQLRRRRRLSYQASLAFLSARIRGIFRFVLATDEEREFLDKEPDPAQWARINQALERLVDHPIWTADFDHSAKTRAVDVALTKNQDLDAALRATGLTTGYVVGADTLAGDWADD